MKYDSLTSINLRPLASVLSLTALVAVAGCASMGDSKPMAAMGMGDTKMMDGKAMDGKMMDAGMKMFDQSALPAAVQVPAGHKVFWETVGAGEITYECRAKANMADQFEWVFVGPEAVLMDRAGSKMGRYFGPPATWEGLDGAKVTGAQVAVSPAAAGSIPLQLVKANPAMGQGKVSGTSYIQRVATQGGVAPAEVCNATMQSARKIVKYQADYIFWRPAS